MPADPPSRRDVLVGRRETKSVEGLVWLPLRGSGVQDAISGRPSACGVLLDLSADEAPELQREASRAVPVLRDAQCSRLFGASFGPVFQRLETGMASAIRPGPAVLGGSGGRSLSAWRARIGRSEPSGLWGTGVGGVRRRQPTSISGRRYLSATPSQPNGSYRPSKPRFDRRPGSTRDSTDATTASRYRQKWSNLPKKVAIVQ